MQHVDRIDEAIGSVIESILDGWDDWDAEAQQAAQCEQNADVWLFVMRESLRAAIERQLAERLADQLQPLVRPALMWLLNHDDQPGECCDCPFGEPAKNAVNTPNPADPGEGDYDCSLLGPEETSRRNCNKTCWTFGLQTVWGESPLCAREDWRKRAKEELQV